MGLVGGGVGLVVFGIIILGAGFLSIVIHKAMLVSVKNGMVNWVRC